LFGMRSQGIKKIVLLFLSCWRSQLELLELLEPVEMHRTSRMVSSLSSILPSGIFGQRSCLRFYRHLIEWSGLAGVAVEWALGLAGSLL
jgi:hypothetical protein